MNSIEEFNGLNGNVVSRDHLKNLSNKSAKEEQVHLVKKIDRLLYMHPDAQNFEIELIGKQTEIAPQSLLSCLECIETDDKNEVGLSKPVSPDDIYQMITDKMLEALKDVSGNNYKKKWKVQNDEGYLIPFNFKSKKPYRGVNVLLLTKGLTEVLKNPFFLTFNQVQELNGKVKKGSSGFPVVYFTKLYSVDEINNGEKISFGTYNRKKFNNWIDKNAGILKYSAEYYKSNYIPILKYYNVYNGADIEGVNFDLDNFKIGFQSGSEIVKNKDSRIEIADLITKNYPEPQPKLENSKNGKAQYKFNITGSIDIVSIPKFENFETGLDYYRTLFHEYSHSTGIASRNNRDLSGKFGSPKYAKEELCAEFGAIFLSAHAGIIWHSNTNHAEYIKNWSNALKHIKEDNRFIMRAASLAQASTDFILNLDKEGIPTYQKELLIKNIDKEKTLAAENKKDDYVWLIKSYKKFEKHTRGKIIEVLKNKKNVSYLVEFEFGGSAKIPAENFVGLKKKPKDYSRKPIVENIVKRKPSKSNKSRKNVKQTALFGGVDSLKENKLGLNGLLQDNIVLEPKRQLSEAVDKSDPLSRAKFSSNNNQDKVKGINGPTSNKIKPIGASSEEVNTEFFNVPGDVGKFLQRVERKKNESVVITMDGQQGAGKTTTLYKFMNSFAKGGSKSLFASLEEHPTSALARDKVSKYIDQDAQENIDIIADFEDQEEFYSLIDPYEVVFIDSWQKLLRMIGNIRLDEDLRKRFDGKVFVVIFQQTTTGRTKGGAEVVFDGDIIIKMVKEASFNENYAYFDKNRYTLEPLENLRYNIASGKVYNPNTIQNDDDSFNVPTYSKEPKSERILSVRSLN